MRSPGSGHAPWPSAGHRWSKCLSYTAICWPTICGLWRRVGRRRSESVVGIFVRLTVRSKHVLRAHLEVALFGQAVAAEAGIGGSFDTEDRLMRVAVLNVKLRLCEGWRLHDTSQHIAGRYPYLQILGLATYCTDCQFLAEYQRFLVRFVQQMHLKWPSCAPNHAVPACGALGSAKDGITQRRANHITILRGNSRECCKVEINAYEWSICFKLESSIGSSVRIKDEHSIYSAEKRQTRAYEQRAEQQVRATCLNATATRTARAQTFWVLTRSTEIYKLEYPERVSVDSMLGSRPNLRISYAQSFSSKVCSICTEGKSARQS